MKKQNVLKAVGAGVTATIAMTIMTMIAPMMGMPEMNIPKMVSGFMGMPIGLGWIAHFMIGTMFAIVYASVFVSILPGNNVVKGAIFGIFPWLLLQIMMNPMMDAGFFSMNAPAPMVALMESFIGHVVYGVVLGAVYGAKPSQPAAVNVQHN